MQIWQSLVLVSHWPGSKHDSRIFQKMHNIAKNLEVVLLMGFCLEMLDTLVYPFFWLLYKILITYRNKIQQISYQNQMYHWNDFWYSQKRFHCLTLWERGYDIFVLRFRPNTNSCQWPYQCLSSSTDCARELFKGLNRSSSILLCTRKKKFLVGGCGFFVSDVINGRLFGHLGPLYLALNANR